MAHPYQIPMMSFSVKFKREAELSNHLRNYIFCKHDSKTATSHQRSYNFNGK